MFSVRLKTVSTRRLLSANVLAVKTTREEAWRPSQASFHMKGVQDE